MGLFKQMKQAMSPEAIKQGMDLSKQSMSSKSGLMPTKGDRDAVMAQGNEYKRLAQVGRPGNAVIVSAADSGERAAGNTVATWSCRSRPRAARPIRSRSATSSPARTWARTRPAPATP